jgi:hypothetical protein
MFRKGLILLSVTSVMVLYVGTSHAAEARLNIKTRVVRCVTEAEKREMCEMENLCCPHMNISLSEPDFETRSEKPSVALSTAPGPHPERHVTYE